jgi:hypothetical protein
MPESLFAPEMLPFAVALGLVVLLAVVEAASLLLGGSLSAGLDSAHDGLHADVGHADIGHAAAGHLHVEPHVEPGAFAKLLDWLCVGRVPALILLIIFLCGFGFSGLAIQGGITALAGHALHPVLASVGAAAAALPITRLGGTLFARIMPRDQTEAVSRDSFVGRVAVVTAGTARRGLPAEAKLRDAFGQTHYLRVEPDDEQATLVAGTEVLIVRRDGAVFHAITAAGSATRPAISA